MDPISFNFYSSSYAHYKIILCIHLFILFYPKLSNIHSFYRLPYPHFSFLQFLSCISHCQFTLSTLQRISTSCYHTPHPPLTISVSYFFSSGLVYQNLLLFPLIPSSPLCFYEMMMMFQIVILPFSCAFIFSLSSHMFIYYTVFHVIFLLSLANPPACFSSWCIWIHILLNLSATLWLVKCFFCLARLSRL